MAIFETNADASATLGAVPKLERSVAYFWYPILLLTIVNLFNYMDRMALAVMLPVIKIDLALSDGQLGLLVGIAFSLFYAMAGIPIAWWADRGIRRDIISASLGLWSLMTAASGLAQNFWHLFIARIGVGVGEAGGVAPAHSMICDYAPLAKRPGLFAIHTLGGIGGISVGISVAGWLSEAIGWRMAFAALGLPGLLLAVLIALSMKEPPRGTFDSSASPRDARTTVAASMKVLWRGQTFRRLVYYSILNNFVQFGLNQWWPSFFARTFDVTSGQIGLHLGLSSGVGAGLGLLVGGALANRLAERDIRLPLKLGGAAKILELIAAVLALIAPTFQLSIIAVGFVGFFWCFSTGAVLAALYSVVLPDMRVLAGAATNFLSSLLGIGLGPVVVGFLSDYLSRSLRLEGLGYALFAPLVLLPVSALLLWRSSRRLPEDLQAAGALA